MAKFDPMDHENCDEDMAAVAMLATTCSCHRNLPWTIRWEDKINGILAKKQLFPQIAVEIGSWAGATTTILAGLGYRTFAVDPWTGNPDDRLGPVADKIGPANVCRTFCRNMGSHLFCSVFPLVGTSHFWSSVWPIDLPIDFLYIDGDHRYEYVRDDILNWSRFVPSGCIIAGHDFGEFEGVTRAVMESGPFERAGKSVWWRTKE